MTGLLQDLALLGLALATLAGVVTAVGALAAGRRDLARGVALVWLTGFGLYAAALLGLSLASRERMLAPGEEKSVAGFDPHLHFCVTGATGRSAAGGLLVTVRVRSDAAAAIQDPASLVATLVDGRGRQWRPVASSAGAATQGGLTVFARRLAPGENYAATLEFRPPPGARGLRLLVRESAFPCVLTIGHELSPLHRRTWFALPG
jgi:hypothetical protein